MQKISTTTDSSSTSKDAAVDGKELLNHPKKSDKIFDEEEKELQNLERGYRVSATHTLLEMDSRLLSFCIKPAIFYYQYHACMIFRYFCESTSY